MYPVPPLIFILPPRITEVNYFLMTFLKVIPEFRGGQWDLAEIPIEKYYRWLDCRKGTIAVSKKMVREIPKSLLLVISLTLILELGEIQWFLGFLGAPTPANQGLCGFSIGWSMDRVSMATQSLPTPCVAILDRKYWFSLPAFHRSNSVTQAVTKLLTRDLTWTIQDGPSFIETT